MSFKDKVVIVTGSGAGIGKAAAIEYAKQGAKVVVGTLNEIRGNQVVDIINSNTEGEGLFVQLDVTEEKSVRNLVQTTIKKFSKIDILVNNAGVHKTGDVVEVSIGDWDDIMNVNLKGAFLCSKYTVPFMLENKNGVIINVSSEAGLVGINNQVAYNVSKAGMLSLTKSMAVDYASREIRVNAVCPGTTDTPLVQNVLSNSPNPFKKRSELEQTRPLNRLGRPEEIAKAIVMLSSEELGYATGSILTIDGGLTAQ